MPDVTAILDDPEVGGGISFKVIRETATRDIEKGYVKNMQVFNVTGNIQPQDKSNQASTPEDKLDESIVIYTTFTLQTGVNNVDSIIEADIIFYRDLHWRVTKVEDWSEWGYTRGYATRTMDEDRWKNLPEGE